MPFQKGKPRPQSAGRKKGSLNKNTVALKDAILGALHAKGGQEYLERVAEKNPAVFCALLGKLVPQEINNTIQGSARLVIVEEIIDGDTPKDDPTPPGPS